MQTFTRQTCNKQWPTVMVPRYPPTTSVEGPLLSVTWGALADSMEGRALGTSPVYLVIVIIANPRLITTVPS